MNRNEIPEVTPEVKAAWDVIADYLNKHPKLTFFISPWANMTDGRYILHYMDGSKEVEIVAATRPHKK